VRSIYTIQTGDMDVRARFSKYLYHSSKTLNWVPPNHTIHLKFII